MGFLDIAGTINELICKALVTLASGIFGVYNAIMNALINTTYLSGTLDSLLGNTKTLWNTITGIHQTLIIPIGEGILALFMLIQLIKLSQRIDATSTLPAVKDIVFLFVTYTIMHWCILHSLDLLTGIYDIFNNIVEHLLHQGNNTSFTITIGNVQSEKATFGFGVLDLENMDVDWKHGVSIGSCINLVFVAILAILTAVVAYIVGLIVAMARAVQMYIYATFSPIPISLLGFEETRQTGIAFFKNFCALALAGVIMVFLMKIYPIMLTEMILTGGENEDLAMAIIRGSAGIGTVMSFFKWCALTFLFIAGLVKSGSWAKELLGN